MKPFKNILLAIRQEDESEAAIERAVALAQENEAQLKVVELRESVEREEKLLSLGVPARDLHRAAVRKDAERLEQFIAPLKEQGIAATARGVYGRPVVGIIREVLRHQHDLVMITAEGPGRFRGTLFGTTTTIGLTRKCPCPVWVTGPTQARTPRRILAAVNPDHFHDPENDARNSRILEVAMSLARSGGAELHLVGAWLVLGEGVLRQRGYPRQVDEIVCRNRARYERALEEMLEPLQLGDLKYKVHLVKGEAPEVITELATKKQVELVVIGTVGRTGISGLLTGNTAEEVLPRLDCSALIVKRDGAVSPVAAEG